MKNPSAFPLPEYREFARSESAEGMTLRDYFAGQALAGFASQYGISGPDAQIANAIRCYQIAKAMLVEREAAMRPTEAQNADPVLLEVLTSLTNEIGGIWRAFEFEITKQIGVANYDVVKIRIKSAQAAIVAAGNPNHVFTGEPDPTDLARDYNEAAEYGNQPTEYDP